MCNLAHSNFVPFRPSAFESVSEGCGPTAGRMSTSLCSFLFDLYMSCGYFPHNWLAELGRINLGMPLWYNNSIFRV
jgi:hypothetical protein